MALEDVKAESVTLQHGRFMTPVLDEKEQLQSNCNNFHSSGPGDTAGGCIIDMNLSTSLKQ